VRPRLHIATAPPPLSKFHFTSFLFLLTLIPLISSSFSYPLFFPFLQTNSVSTFLLQSSAPNSIKQKPNYHAIQSQTPQNKSPAHPQKEKIPKFSSRQAKNQHFSTSLSATRRKSFSNSLPIQLRHLNPFLFFVIRSFHYYSGPYSTNFPLWSFLKKSREQTSLFSAGKLSPS
jgi:hypothetical protein